MLSKACVVAHVKNYQLFALDWPAYTHKMQQDTMISCSIYSTRVVYYDKKVCMYEPVSITFHGVLVKV